MRYFYKTVVLSDIHLGTSGSKAKEVSNFLRSIKCETLILNGDIIDGWQLKKYGKWKKKHTRVIKEVLKLTEKHNTKVYYVRGNHDDFLDQFLPLQLGSISIVRDFIYESNGKRFYVTHGDIFDSITTNLKWLAKLGDIGYTFLLWVNKLYNNYRTNRGLPYYSLSQAIKHKVKKAVQYIDDFETQLAEVGKIQNCDAVLCGHIHQPAIRDIDGITYMNSGDWVETLSALVENENGEWELIYYDANKHEQNIDIEDEPTTYEPLEALEKSSFQIDELTEILRKVS